MRNTIIRKIIIAILATLSLCLVLSVIGYTPKGEQEPNSSYMTFMELFILYLIFVAPMFVTVGIVFSIVVELKIKSITKTIVSYAVGGGIIGVLYYSLIVVMQANSTILSEGILLFTSVGASAALLFFGVQVVLKPLFSKLNLN